MSTTSITTVFHYSDSSHDFAFFAVIPNPIELEALDRFAGIAEGE
jgi:hypothetical protein